MRFELRLEDQVIVNAEIDLPALFELLRPTDHRLNAAPSAVIQSVTMTRGQIDDLLCSIDPKSSQFLRKIGENNGTISWQETRAIFGIVSVKDWSAYASVYGRGITKAVRRITGLKSGRLVWWNQREWNEAAPDPFFLHVDGPALQALRR